MITNIIRLCVVALFIIAVVIGWHSINKDNPGVPFIYMIVVGVIAGLVGVKYLIPWIGDVVGTFFFSSGEKIVMDDNMKAAAKLAQGDYEGAIAEYEKLARDKPEDAFPLAEIAKIYSDKMDDPRRAISFLHERLESKEWEPDAGAFLMFRIVDLYADRLKDYREAHELLDEVIANFPNTRHSANAHHKLREVDEAQFKAIAEQRLKGGTQNG